MQKVAIALGLATLVLASVAGWQIGVCELANFEFQDDIQDLASQLGIRIGLSSASSDEDFRNSVLRCAKRYQINLTPDQVAVQRSGSGPTATISLTADYTVPIHLPGFLHSSLRSDKREETYPV